MIHSRHQISCHHRAGEGRGTVQKPVVDVIRDAEGDAHGRLHCTEVPRRPARRCVPRDRRVAGAGTASIMAPVSIPTGQAILQVESPRAGALRRRSRRTPTGPRSRAIRRAGAASRAGARSVAGESSSDHGWGTPARRSRIRCRGRRRHPMVGMVFACWRWAPGSRFSTTSRSEHSVRVERLLDPPHDLRCLCAPLRLQERRHIRPVACSALREPSNRSITMAQNSSMNAA